MKLALAILALALVAGVAYLSLSRVETADSIAIRQLQPMDSGILESWDRVTDERDLFGISASKINRANWQWQVFVSVAEFVREDPLESILNRELETALREVRGVEEVVHEDQEVWIIAGDPNGEALVRSAAGVVDKLEPELRRYFASLETR